MDVFLLISLLAVFGSSLGACPEGWQTIGNTCYLWSTKLDVNSGDRYKTWRQSRAYCQANGAELASIHGADDQRALEGLVMPSDSFSMWIGLNELDDSYKWSDGSAMTYTNWGPGQPNDWNGHEQCVEMFTNKEQGSSITLTKKDGKIIFGRINAPTRNFIQIDIKACKEAYVVLSEYKYKLANPVYIIFGANNNQQTIIKDQASQTQATSDTPNILKCGEDRRFYVSWRDGMIEAGRWNANGAQAVVQWRRSMEVDGVGVATVGVNGRFTTSGLPGEWNDQLCSLSNGFICQKSDGPTAPPVTPTIKSGFCPEGFLPYMSKCYKLVYTGSENTIKWDDAQAACAALATGKRCNLASVSSSSEQAFVTSLVGTRERDVWFGLRQLRPGQWLWQDNEDVVYTNWRQGKPMRGKSTKLCGTLVGIVPSRAGQWVDNWCNKAMQGYLCAMSVQEDLPRPPPLPNPCGTPDWIPYRGSCYQFMVDPMDWDGARLYCERNGATLSSITSAYEQAFVQALLDEAENEPFWLGLSDSENPGTFRWIDDWPVSYVNWGKGQPSRDDGGCVKMNVDGRWFDIDCNEQYTFLCKRSTAEPPHTYPPMVGSCQVPGSKGMDWVGYGGHCFHFELDARVSQSEAIEACDMYGANLTSIHDRDEMKFLRTRLRQTADVKTWIGLRRGDKSGWSWLDGTVVNFVNWANGAPEDKEGASRACAQVRPMGKWLDAVCDSKAGYICRLPQFDPPTKDQGAAVSPGEIAGIIVSTVALIAVVSVLALMILQIKKGGDIMNAFKIGKNT